MSDNDPKRIPITLELTEFAKMIGIDVDDDDTIEMREAVQVPVETLTQWSEWIYTGYARKVKSAIDALLGEEG